MVSFPSARFPANPYRTQLGTGVSVFRGATNVEDGDLAVVNRCKEQDPAAFEILVHRYKNKIYNFVCRMINNPEDAEDVTQEIFLRVYTRIRYFRGESSFQTWLYRIATNLCVDRSRKIKRQPAQAFSLDECADDQRDDDGREIPDDRSDPYRALAREELRLIVQEGLGRLSPKLRTVILLYDIQGLSYEEIATILGVPMGTVKSRLFNARAELAKRLQSYVIPS